MKRFGKLQDVDQAAAALKHDGEVEFGGWSFELRDGAVTQKLVPPNKESSYVKEALRLMLAKLSI